MPERKSVLRNRGDVSQDTEQTMRLSLANLSTSLLKDSDVSQPIGNKNPCGCARIRCVSGDGGLLLTGRTPRASGWTGGHAADGFVISQPSEEGVH